MSMNENTPKKEKKTHKNKGPDVSKLAADILKDTESEEVIETMEEDVPEVPDIVEEQQSQGKIPQDEKIIQASPTPVVFRQGMLKTDAFVVHRRIEEVYKILEHHFGSANGDYFVINENTSTLYKDNQRKRYKCMLVEDKNGFRYGLWFDITNIGPVY